MIDKWKIKGSFKKDVNGCHQQGLFEGTYCTLMGMLLKWKEGVVHDSHTIMNWEVRSFRISDLFLDWDVKWCIGLLRNVLGTFLR